MSDSYVYVVGAYVTIAIRPELAEYVASFLRAYAERDVDDGLLALADMLDRALAERQA